MESIEDTIKKERELESSCGVCGLTMQLEVIRKKLNTFDKGHKMYVCSCGNKFRARSFNEILRDLQIKE